MSFAVEEQTPGIRSKSSRTELDIQDGEHVEVLRRPGNDQDLSLFEVHGTLIRSMGSTQIKVFPEICFGKNFMQQVQRVKKFSQVNGGHKRSY